MTDDALQRLKESYLEVRAPASTAASARDRFEASNHAGNWGRHPGLIAASVLLAVVLIPIALNRSNNAPTADSLMLPSRDFAFPGLSVIDLPAPRVLSIQRPDTAIEIPRPTPVPTFQPNAQPNDEALL